MASRVPSDAFPDVVVSAVAGVRLGACALALAAALMAVSALGACSQPEADVPVGAAVLEERVAAAFEQARADAARIEQERAEAARLEQERIERERAEAEAARAEQARIDAWRARFPLDDYANTLLIGDSLMQNATVSLQEAMPGVAISADAGRTLETGGLVFEKQSPDKGILDHVRNDSGSYARYVIGAGNNDYGGMPLSAAEEIVACLGSDKEIYFITEMVTGNSYGTGVTNAAIEEVVARYPNVHAIDWHGLVAGHEAEYLSDGCHPRRDREPDYAACIKAALDVTY